MELGTSMRITIAASISIVLIAFTGRAVAEDTPLQSKATQVDRQIGLVLAPETIASDPINATPAEIAAHAMPPQPDPVTDPVSYWPISHFRSTTVRW